ncbi:MAG: DNA recombination protein RmuC [Pacificimonas sp.]|nr:DNA recombination protein RmuC [Pacificimonas sp.]
MTTETIVLAAGALILGVGLGWLIWGRSLGPARAEREAARAAAEEERAAHAATRDDLAMAKSDRALAERDVANAGEKLVEARAEIERLRPMETNLARIQSSLSERDKNFADREADLDKRFAVLAEKALEGSTEKFLKRAKDVLEGHEKAAGRGLEKNRGELEKLIAPMRDTLTKYQERLKEIEDKRANAYGAITTAIAQVREGQEGVRDEARRIVGALRNAPKARGRWGEQQLRRVLEMAGLSPHCDFAEEVHVTGEDGTFRPDVVVNLPQDRVLVIDAKVSLNSYEDAQHAETDDERAAHLLAHAKAIRHHVDTLGKKSYTRQFDDTLDFVIMFVPGENFLAAALETDQELFNTAFEKGVLLAGPTNLIAIARTVAMVWQQERAAENVREIAALGKELYERLATMGDHVARVGKNLDQATGAYNKMVGSLESQVLTSARRFKDLDIDPPKKELSVLEPAATEARDLSKLAAPVVGEVENARGGEATADAGESDEAREAAE